jgi:hypothetical protein
MPWAATNSPALKAHLDDGTTAARILRTAMFGQKDSPTVASDVQVLTILQNDLGQQTINYNDEKAINVGPWSVTLSDNPSGFQFPNGGSFSNYGILGLDWQPVLTSEGSVNTILSQNTDPTTSGSIESTIYWPANKDFGLSAWLDNNWNVSAYDNDCYIWVGSSCYLAKGEADTTTDPLEYSVLCYPAQFNSPNENVFASVDNQGIFVTNYPQSIGGMTANLFGVEMDSDGNNNSGSDPYTLRTGKVNPGVTDNGMGQWKVGVGGFTDQLKIKAPMERFSATLKGYKFNTNDLAIGDLPNLERNVVHAPHIKVIEKDLHPTSPYCHCSG